MEKSVKKGIGRAELFAAAILWGLAGVCVKSISWSSMSLMAARSILSLIVLLSFKRSFRIRFTKTNVFGGIMMALTGILYVESIKLTTAGTAIVLQYIAPILVYLFGVLFKKRRINAKEMFIVFAVFVGCVLSFADQLDATHIIGNILGLLSGFTFAGEIIISSESGTDTEDCLIISNIIALLFCLPFTFFDKSLVFNTKNILWVLVLGIFQYGFANLLFSKGIKKVDALEASLILTIEPIFNPIPVWIICNEKMGPLAIIGSVIVIFFVALYSVIPRKYSDFVVENK